MTEETFTELVNLYLDGEISEKDLSRLKSELAADAHRREVFVERNRLHKAMRLALNSQTLGRGQRVGFPRFSRWLLGTGLAASLVFAWVFFSPAFLDRGGYGPLAVEVGSASDSEADVIEQALSDWSSEADLRRYASRQQRELANERASLAAQLRLMGLRPELTPENKTLRAIDRTALKAESTQSQAEVLNKLQRQAVMPKARILRSDADWNDRAEGSFNSYGGGFESSLISFR
ncbi:MAG: hypothetical protein GVY36_06250 [Verrucomicrobia bacterium]|jgi:hypothetical protein|nr:hypothetical protein [Verrucomicrobiota bacterium]